VIPSGKGGYPIYFDIANAPRIISALKSYRRSGERIRPLGVCVSTIGHHVALGTKATWCLDLKPQNSKLGRFDP
jgi:hypothetical protein